MMRRRHIPADCYANLFTTVQQETESSQQPGLLLSALNSIPRRTLHGPVVEFRFDRGAFALPLPFALPGKRIVCATASGDASVVPFWRKKMRGPSFQPQPPAPRPAPDDVSWLGCCPSPRIGRKGQALAGVLCAQPLHLQATATRQNDKQILQQMRKQAMTSNAVNHGRNQRCEARSSTVKIPFGLLAG
jgi:hypothetical protein